MFKSIFVLMTLSLLSPFAQAQIKKSLVCSNSNSQMKIELNQEQTLAAVEVSSKDLNFSMQNMKVEVTTIYTGGVTLVLIPNSEPSLITSAGQQIQVLHDGLIVIQEGEEVEVQLRIQNRQTGANQLTIQEYFVCQ